MAGELLTSIGKDELNEFGFETITCFYCRGEGTTEGCSHCGKVKEDTIINKEVVKNLKIIPDFYKGKEWSMDKFYTFKPELKSNIRLQEFVQMLDKFHNIMKRKPVSQSVFIAAPPKMSKSTFVMSCLQVAANHTDSIAPFIDTITANRILTKDSEQDNDTLRKEILFVRVTNTYLKVQAVDLMRELLRYRAYLNLPTYFISDYGSEKLAGQRITYLKDYSRQENPLLYPCFFEFF